jgi:hypothetical protein
MQSCCVSSESLTHSPPKDRLAHNAIVPYTRVCFLWVTASFPFPLIKGPTTQPTSSFLYVAPFTPLPSSHSIQQWLPRAGMNTVFGPELWHQHSEDFEANFPLKGESDFRSIRDVRSYALKQTVLWPRCSHGEFCVMQVYEGWNNSGCRF